MYVAKDRLWLKKKLLFLENGTWIHIKSHGFLEGLCEPWPVLFTDLKIHAMIPYHLHGRVFERVLH